VGESLWGVGFAGIVAATGSDAPLSMVGPDAPLRLIGGDFFIPALVAGLALFAALTWYLYRRTMREAVG